MKAKVLFIMHMPPPVHGAAMVGQWIHDSKVINETFDCHYINPSASTKVSEVGKINFSKIIFLFQHICEVVRTIRSVRPNICYYTPTSSGWGIYRDLLAISIVKLFDIRILLHLHNKGVNNFAKDNPFAKFAFSHLYKNNKVILLAEELYTDIKDFVPRSDISFLPNGIPPTIDNDSYQNIIEERKKTASKRTRFLFLSNMMTEKGIWVLLDACKLLKDGNIDFECHYVGNWGDTTSVEFQAKIDRLGLTNEIYIHGPKYNKDKYQYFAQSDVFVFPTYYRGETFGLVLLEAMEYGLPCISTFEGGIPSVVEDGKTGLLVTSQDAKQLYEMMKILSTDAVSREKIGQNGRYRFLSNFTIRTFEEGFIDILNTQL